MVGVDDNAYSDHALQWLLDELVDDGDEIVCVRVIETQVRLADKTYQEDAARLMESIKAKNTQNHAISLILEYAVGKLHSTFQHLVRPPLLLCSVPNGAWLLTSVSEIDQDVFTIDVDCRHQRPQPRWCSGVPCQPQLVFEILPAVLPSSSCCRETYGETREKET